MNVNTYIKRFIIRPVYNTPNDFPVEALVTDKLEIVYEAYAHAMGVRPKDIQFMHQGKMLTVRILLTSPFCTPLYINYMFGTFPPFWTQVIIITTEL